MFAPIAAGTPERKRMPLRTADLRLKYARSALTASKETIDLRPLQA